MARPVPAGPAAAAELATRPLRESDAGGGDDDGPGPRAGADTAKRDFQWLPDGSIAFLQQEPAPNGARGAANADSTDVVGAASGQPLGPRAPGGPAARRRDRLVKWTPPFDASASKALLESDSRIGGVLFSDDAKSAFVAENANGTGHVYAVYFDEPGKKYTIWRVRGLNASVGGAGRGFGGGGGRGGHGRRLGDVLSEPGQHHGQARPRRRAGRARSRPTASTPYLQGTRYFKTWQDSAPHGFVDKVEIETGRSRACSRARADAYETVTRRARRRLLEVRRRARESPTMVPDSYLRDATSGQLHEAHEQQGLRAGVHGRDAQAHAGDARRRLQVHRNVTLPKDYKAGTRLPGIIWFYPTSSRRRQATIARCARRTSTSSRTPARARIEIWVTQGYAVADLDPPIVGPTGRMNDHYVAELRDDPRSR